MNKKTLIFLLRESCTLRIFFVLVYLVEIINKFCFIAAVTDVKNLVTHSLQADNLFNGERRADGGWLGDHGEPHRRHHHHRR